MASVQGGVFPEVLHGSSVTYKVESANRGALPFATPSAIASLSAWGKPAFLWNPEPITWFSCTMTAPTQGFGLVSPIPFEASFMAMFIQQSSWFFVFTPFCSMKTGRRTITLCDWRILGLTILNSFFCCVPSVNKILNDCKWEYWVSFQMLINLACKFVNNIWISYSHHTHS